MDFTDVPLGNNDIDRRIDKLIRKYIPNMPLSLIYKNFRNGLIKINNKKIKPEQKIQQDDVLQIANFLLKDINQPNINDDLYKLLPAILFKNEDILILNKPYDLLVQKTNINDKSLDQIVKSDFAKNNKNNSISFLPGPLHRLDRNTSGIICFSQSLKGARFFSEYIKNHQIQKKYLGIVQGHLKENQEWQDNIEKEYNKNKKFQTVKASFTREFNHTNCITIAKPLKYGIYNNIQITLVEFEIKTGKTHQIRSQASLHNFPLLNDTAYGAKSVNLKQKYFLHAYKLIFPQNNELNIPKIITSEPEQEMSVFINKYFKKNLIDYD